MSNVWRHVAGLVGSALGFMVLGFYLPIAFVLWNFDSREIAKLQFRISGTPMDAWLRVIEVYVVDGLLWCSPLGVMFACLIQSRLWVRIDRDPTRSFQSIAMLGMLTSIGLTFLNLPAYVIHVDYSLRRDSLGVLKGVLLFVLSGAASGWWTAWQAWRVIHEDAPFWPQVSLKGLLIVVVILGGMMGLFRPG